jgi:glycerophosphoryl diester phosphodiesterase
MTTAQTVLNIAHRGARSLAPENTLAAARAALDAGADMWELDVSLTADGIPVLLHDDTLERTSNVADIFPERRPWLVSRFSLAELRRLDFGSWFVELDPFRQIAAGNLSPDACAALRGEAIPTLREALDFTREHRWRVNVEIKFPMQGPADDGVVGQVVAMIEELGLAEQVIVSSFYHPYLARVKALNPALATGALVHQTPAENPVDILTRLQAVAYHPSRRAILPADIVSLRAQGFDVNVYTVNDEALMQTLIESQASGIITDFPQTLAALLRRKPM